MSLYSLRVPNQRKCDRNTLLMVKWKRGLHCPNFANIQTCMNKDIIHSFNHYFELFCIIPTTVNVSACIRFKLVFVDFDDVSI